VADNLTRRPAFGAGPPGAMPLTADEVAELIPSDLATRADLDLAELENIVGARLHFATREWTSDQLTDTSMVRNIHRRMFNQVWRWAGTWRRRETSIGVAPEAIAVDLRNSLDDARAWIEWLTFPADEIAVRLHHRLVQVHPFPNGNGRHARLLADLVVVSLGGPPFAWSGGHLAGAGDTRTDYLVALRRMDKDRDDADALVQFARGSGRGTAMPALS